ncbi:hypothetical protein DQG13_03035 [Paenibacillus sp. YN15]|nr:hypothetical protein DQG13_03035 [Paenibacillus sp. YN15]
MFFGGTAEQPNDLARGMGMQLLKRYRNTVFTRLILSYTVFSIILVGMAGGYLYSRANRLMLEEIAKESDNRLQAVQRYAEETLLRQYEESVENKAKSTYYFVGKSDLNMFLENGWENNLFRIFQFREELLYLKQSLEGAAAVTVYFSNRDYVVDSNSFYTTVENSPDKEFMLQAQAGELPAGVWLNRTLSDSKEVMTYAVKLPYYTLKEPPAGYIFIDVERDYVYNAVTRIMNSSGKLYILDKNGAPVFNGTGEEEWSMIRTALHSGKPVNEFSNGDDRYVMAHLQSPKNDWTYVIVRPLNAFSLSTKEFQTQLFACGLAVLVFGFIMSYFMSRQLYTPLKGLIQYIRGFYPHSGSGQTQGWVNEYAYISNALKNMDEKIGVLEAKTKRSELRNLVLGAPMELEQMDMLPAGYSYSMGYIRILEGSPELLGEVYEQMEHPVPGIFIALNQTEAAIIYYARENHGVDHDDAAAILGELRQLQQEIRGDIRFGGATGSWVESVENIPLSYQSARMAYRYCFFFGTDAIIHYASLQDYTPRPLIFSFEQYQHILKAGDINGTNRFIDGFAETLKQNMQLETVELALLQISSAIYQVVIELELQLLLPPSNLFDDLKKDTLDATVDNIRTLSVQIAAHVKETGNQAHAEVVQKLKTYIDEHLEENLSLNILSDVASLAPAYVSTLFGEVMKESFTDYVTRVRLDKAAAMLRENTELSVTEIAGQVGYKNVQYFHNKFKQKYGVTPVQYRQAMKG